MAFLKKIFIFILLVIFLSIFWFFYRGLAIKSAPLLISSNITPATPLYYIKVGREYFQSLLIFGDEDLSFWYLNLAEKRLKEAEKLHQNGLINLSKEQVETAKIYQNLGNSYLKKLINKVDTNYLHEKSDDNLKMINSLNKK